jgi:hypothetical protein
MPPSKEQKQEEHIMEHNNSLVLTPAAKMLPAVPNDEALLNALKAGGVLKVEATTVAAAIRVGLAANVGYFRVPGKLIAAMDERAESLSEPVGAEYYQARDVVLKNNGDYADLFRMIDGFKGEFATMERKNVLIAKLNNRLWNVIDEAFMALNDWREAWKDNSTDSTSAMLALIDRENGDRDTGLSALLFPAPDTGMVKDAVAALNNALNKIFAGTAVQITAALAHDAVRVKELLMIENLPKLTGYSTREEMLIGLGLTVTPEMMRTEQNLVQFTLGLLEFPNKPAEEEMKYLAALWSVGSQIDWYTLTNIC